MTRSLDPPYGAADPGGMLARIEALADQVGQALERGAAAPWGPRGITPDLLAVGALGGSAIAADLTAGLYGDRLPHPLVVVREYRWPAFVTRASLTLLCSYSGDTEETLSLYRQAGERGVPRAAVSSGGRLTEWCERDRVPLTRVPGGSPPRAALFGSWVGLTGLLHGLGWIEDPAPAWREAAAVLAAGALALGGRSPEAANPAKRIARSFGQKRLFIYAASERLGPVVTRVRNQINENAKLLSHSALVPELNHNEIVGWEIPGEGHAGSAVLVLRDREDAAQVSKRLTLTAEYATSRGATVHEWSSIGEGRLARLASLVQFGDYLSFYLALLNGADPTPIPSIDEFKRRLAAP
ncbi:MAG: bifunctional phosphoglucose/phosphomannose isomerase [Candidatus Eisenbacteria bacterium]|nr:bifunctional phosphoglucose/phosphomannose isomerase [Candidatus Eisenbacteria bacterium]